MHVLLDKIDQLFNTEKRIILAIDGGSTSGKSTLAAFLKDTYACNVISMDHFFLKPDMRTTERLSQPGGNIDYDRFIDQIILPLKSGESFAYPPYNCQTGEYDEPVNVDINLLTIVEGVYSMHPMICEHSVYRLTVFLQIDEDEQKRRLLLRNPHMYGRFINEWVPMENKYFEYFKIADKCDYVTRYNFRD